jgi:heterotetrameric sarcosine oxidase gamma subunit
MTSAGSGNAWIWRGPWTGLFSAGRHGAAGAAGVVIAPRGGLGIASLIVGAHARDDLTQVVKSMFSLELPSARTAVRSTTHALVSTGPDRWLLLAERHQDFRATLQLLSGVASVTDQSEGRAVLRVSGPRVRDALAKGCMIDVHSSVFPASAAAATSIAHIDVHLWRADHLDDANAAFDIALPRSMAGSFWSWLSSAAAEFGYVIDLADISHSPS